MILGIDPGLASTGYALLAGAAARPRVVEIGTVRTSPRTAHPLRLLALHEAVGTLAERHPVESAALEAWFVHPVSRSAMQMAEARGAILSALAGAGVEVVEYAPNTIKQAATGVGSAGKDQVRAMVARLAGVEPPGDHAADALAAALCHLSSAALRGAVRRST